MRLLVVDDEPKMLRMLARGLSEEGHQVDVCDHGQAALQQALDVPYDAVVLDWGLPDLDGVALLREWRRRGLTAPVLLLTARGSTGEKVTGLRAGADDYLVKPFDFDELVARLEALQRRAGPGEAALKTMGDLTINARRRTLHHAGTEVTLTGRELALLGELMARGSDTATRSHLLSKVWGGDFEGTGNVVDVYVGYLRTKLERVGSRRVSIEAVRGVGYRLVVE
ncbi:MAG: response regulator transcription factor [Archangiaceae bacterium]|nr:response regulator transcription factor [Archangiaceae bacterium]